MCPQKAYANLITTSSFVQMNSKALTNRSFLQLNDSLLDKLKDALTHDNRFNNRIYEQDNNRQLNDILQLVTNP
jgi:hypothetical protein